MMQTNLAAKDLNSMSLAEVAVKLRSTAENLTREEIVSILKWQNEHQKQGSTCAPKFASNGLSFVCSSLNFSPNWEDCNFESKPFGMEMVTTHRLPFACLTVPIPGDNGVQIWISGNTQSANEQIISVMSQLVDSYILEPETEKKKKLSEAFKLGNLSM